MDLMGFFDGDFLASSYGLAEAYLIYEMLEDEYEKERYLRKLVRRYGADAVRQYMEK